MRLTLVIATMAGGGAERVMSTLANAWANDGRNVTLVTFEPPGTSSFYPLESSVELVQLGLLGASSGVTSRITANFSRWRALRAALNNSNPDVIVSFMTETNVLSAFASLGSKATLVVAEHTDPIIHDPGVAWRFLRNLSYRAANRVVVLNQRAQRIFSKQSFGRRVVVIPNPVMVEAPTDNDPAAPCSNPYILAMGRFSPEKRFDLVVEAFSQVAEQFTDWSLVLVGDGTERQEVAKQVRLAGLEQRVHFTGYLQQPQTILRDADAFISASVLEGFPMAICEAMASAIPVVVARYHEGLDELIESDRQAIVVPVNDVSALAEGMEKILKSQSLRKRIGNAGKERVATFSLSAILKQWDALFKQVGIQE